MQNTEKTDLESDFQTVGWQMKHGQIDLVLDRKDIMPTIGTLLSILLKKHPAQDQTSEEDDVSNESLTVKTKEAS